jgi:hypothetical protein
VLIIYSLDDICKAALEKINDIINRDNPKFFDELLAAAIVVQELGLDKEEQFRNWILPTLAAYPEVVRQSSLFKEIVAEGANRALALYTIIGSSAAFSARKRATDKAKGPIKSMFLPANSSGHDRGVDLVSDAAYHAAGYVFRGERENPIEVGDGDIECNVVRPIQQSEAPVREKSPVSDGNMTFSFTPSRTFGGHTPEGVESNMAHSFKPATECDSEKFADTNDNATPFSALSSRLWKSPNQQ